MKGHVVLAALFLMVSCGNNSKSGGGSSSSSTNASSSASNLQNSGVFFNSDPQYGILVISCSEVASVTNSQKLNELTAYRNFVASDYNNSAMIPFGNGQASAYQMNTILNMAIQSLQYADPNSSRCPRQILAQSY